MMTAHLSSSTNTRVMPLWAVVALCCGAAACSGPALVPKGEQATIYSVFSQSRGYVVGAPVTGSGLHVMNTDSSWTRLGWNHPITFSIGFDPFDSNIFYIAAGNGLMRSLDRGVTWKITTDWRMTEVLDVATDPGHEGDLYIGTAYGIWLSRDRGDTWKHVGPTATRPYIEAIVADRSRPGTLIAAGERGLFRSTDRGETWTPLLGNEEYVMEIKQDLYDDTRWWAGSHDHGLLTSTDGGVQWQRVGSLTDEKGVHAIALDATQKGRIAITGWDIGVHVSDDYGVTWTDRTQGLPGCEAYTVITNPPPNPPPCLFETLFDPSQSGRLFAATVESGLFVSDDAGATWRLHGNVGAIFQDMEVGPTAPTLPLEVNR